MRALASDNYAGCHPQVLAAIAAANTDHAAAYGADPWTARAVELIRGELGAQAQVFLTFNGTGANVVGLQSLLRTWEAVVCASTAHINVDEGGAPEKLLGSKILDLPTPDGKLRPEQILSLQWRQGDVHQSQPRAVLITQSSEYGTVYSPAEVAAIADAAHDRGLLLYMDGARLANAAASQGASLAEITRGVDALSLGGTKNGAIAAEAIVLLNPTLDVETIGFIRKQYMQLASKMRFAAAQFIGLHEDGLWLRNASHANAMAAKLAAGLRGLPGVRITQEVQANAVFAALPRQAIPALQEHTPFYVWDEAADEVRLVCSWDTTEADIDDFLMAASRILAGT